MTQAAPGWYPDPHDPNRRRYFDGARWTEHVQAVAPPPGAPGGPGGPPPGAPGAVGVPPPTDPGVIHARGLVVGAAAPHLSGAGAGDGIVHARGMVITPGEPARIFAFLALPIALTWSLGIGSLVGIVLAIIALRRGEEPVTRGVAYGALVVGVIGLSVTIALAVWWFTLR